MADVDGDGDVDASDLDAIHTLYRNNTVINSTNYNADADIDHDGDIDSADYDLAANEGTHPPLARGSLSNVGNIFGFSGYIMNSEASGGGGTSGGGSRFGGPCGAVHDLLGHFETSRYFASLLR